jgi:predicted kinase
VRFLLADDPTDQTINRPVFATVRYLLRRRLELRRPLTFIDATNTTRYERRPWIRLAHLHDADIEAVFFDTPIDICKRRNRQRDRFVPEWAIDNLAARLVHPALTEGFTAVTVLRASEDRPAGGVQPPAAAHSGN